jgi:hypothetical protein
MSSEKVDGVGSALEPEAAAPAPVPVPAPVPALTRKRERDLDDHQDPGREVECGRELKRERERERERELRRELDRVCQELELLRIRKLEIERELETFEEREVESSKRVRVGEEVVLPPEKEDVSSSLKAKAVHVMYRRHA